MRRARRRARRVWRRLGRRRWLLLSLVAAAPLALAFWLSQLATPAPSFLLRDRHGSFLGEVALHEGDEFGYWPLAEVPPRVAAATIAIEDRRFQSHLGVDPLAVLRALRDNLRSGRRVSGASTLAMQVARMQHPGGRHYWRKALEAASAYLMTLRYGREAVLAQYLRIVPYGNRIHGISYAARRYFDKPVSDLSWAETAFLTAIPQAPRHANPFTPSGRVRAVLRGEAILDRLRASGVLSAEEHALARQQIARLSVPPAGERPREALHAVLRYEELLRAAAREGRAPSGIVRSSIDLETQKDAAFAVLSARRAWERDGVGNAALIVLDRGENAVRAWIGSAEYFDDVHAGAIDYTRVPRSPGSALKPFVYALALERGTITPATVLDDIERGPGGIANADDAFQGPLVPRLALGNSRNVPAVTLLERVGLDEAYALLRDLGLHQGREPARRYGLGLTIGALPVSLEALVRAYSVLANDGRRQELRFWDGQQLAEPRRLLSEHAAREVTLFLADPLARLPAFDRLGALEYPFPVAVKTGTSSRFRDAWAVAYSQRYVVGAWVGDPDFQPMKRLTGYRSAAALVQKVLLTLHPDEADGLTDVPFPPPRDARLVRICPLTGKLASDACDRALGEWFRPGEEPVDWCTAHVRLAVDTRTGRRATSRTPRPYLELRTFLDLPPRYASWAAAAGLPPPPALDEPAGAARISMPAAVRLSVRSPENGLRVLRDPESPPEQSTLALRAVVDPPVPQLVWYVDGAPYRVVDYPYTVRWRLAAGEHAFQARLVDGRTASSSVRVIVQ
jgi:penicillin-binding protein 1C